MNFVLPLENKIHIFAPLCNILYIFLWVKMFLLPHYGSKIVLHKRKTHMQEPTFFKSGKKGSCILGLLSAI